MGYNVYKVNSTTHKDVEREEYTRERDCRELAAGVSPASAHAWNGPASRRGEKLAEYTRTEQHR